MCFTTATSEEEDERKAEFKDLQEAYLQDGLAIRILSLLPPTDLASAIKEKSLSQLIEDKAVELLATVQVI